MSTEAEQSFRDWLITTIAAIEEMDTPQEEDIMKVTINPAGDIIFDVDDLRDAVAFAAQLRDNGSAVAETAAEFQARKTAWEAAHPQSTEDPAPVEAPKKKRGRPRKATPEKDSKVLSPALTEVNDYLVDLADSFAEPISPTGLARAFGIKATAMDQRLRQLKKRGLVENIGRGLWQATK